MNVHVSQNNMWCSHRNECYDYSLLGCDAVLYGRKFIWPPISPLLPWRWRQQVPIKHWYLSIKLEGIVFQKTIILILNDIIINLQVLLAIPYRLKHLMRSGLTIISSSWNLFFEILKFYFLPESFSKVLAISKNWHFSF